MKDNYNYQNKIRKEVWVSKPAMKFVTKLAKQEGRSIKAQLEVMLEAAIAEAIAMAANGKPHETAAMSRKSQTSL